LGAALHLCCSSGLQEHLSFFLGFICYNADIFQKLFFFLGKKTGGSSVAETIHYNDECSLFIGDE
jgi:hypothetical protein